MISERGSCCREPLALPLELPLSGGGFSLAFSKPGAEAGFFEGCGDGDDDDDGSEDEDEAEVGTTASNPGGAAGLLAAGVDEAKGVEGTGFFTSVVVGMAPRSGETSFELVLLALCGLWSSLRGSEVLWFWLRLCQQQTNSGVEHAWQRKGSGKRVKGGTLVCYRDRPVLRSK